MAKLIAGTVVLLLVTSVTPALAQTQPFQGLFGAPAGTAPPQSLDLTASVFGVNDTNLPRLGRQLTQGDRTPDVRYGDILGGLWFTKRAAHTSFSANGSSRLQYYPQLANGARWSGTGAVALNRTMRRANFGIDQQVRYSPYAHFRVIPIPSEEAASLADVSAPDSALAVTGRESYRYNTGLRGGYQLAGRTLLSTTYQYELLDFVPAEWSDWKTHDVDVTLSHSVTPTMALVAGYAYHLRDFEGHRLPLRRQDINFGVNYNNSLPFSPRTTFRFMMGSTALSRSTERRLDETDSTFLRMIGRAELDHQLNQTWHVGAFYHRGIQYIEGISDVFLADSVTAQVRGYLGPRVEVRGTMGYSTGPLRYGPEQRAYDTAAATARVRMAITRGLAAQAEYVSYRYVFSDAVTLPTGTAVRGDRQVFRVGLTTWLPLLN
jgi:hypothetical protein